jgi:hypothetical protein
LFCKLKSLEDLPQGQLAGKMATVIDLMTRLPVETQVSGKSSELLILTLKKISDNWWQRKLYYYWIEDFIILAFGVN